MLELEAATEFGSTDEEDPSAGSGTLLLEDGCVFTLLELEAATEFGLIDEEDPSAGSGTLLLEDGCVFTLLELEAATEFGLTDEEDLGFSTLDDDPSAGSGTLLLEDCSLFLLLEDGCVFTLLELDDAAESDLTDEEDLDFSTLEEVLPDFAKELDDSVFLMELLEDFASSFGVT